MPWDLVEAIGQAHRVLDWFENLASEDMPEEWMWPYSELVNEWFDEVRARKGLDDDDTDDRTNVPMVRNEDPRLLKLKSR
jgi:hypothetical protein